MSLSAGVMESLVRSLPARPSVLAVCAIAALAVAAIPVAAVLAQPAAQSFTVIETGRSFASLQDAVNAIGNGQGSISIAPGTYRQCAVQEGGKPLDECEGIDGLERVPGGLRFTAGSGSYRFQYAVKAD